MKTGRFVQIAGAALLALVSASMPAQGQDRRKFEFVLEGVRVDGVLPEGVATQRLDPDDTGYLRAGEERKVRAVLGHTSNDAQHPATRYRVTAGGRYLTITSTNEKHGEAVIEGLGQGVATLSWEVVEPGLRLAARSGRLQIRVQPAEQVVDEEPVAEPPYHGPSDSTLQGRANEVVRGLYRGILLRDPDPSSVGYVQTIQRSSWSGLQSVAQTMAESNESRRDVYSREGVGNEERLVVLYRELLGYSEDDIPEDDWNYQLRQLESRQYAEVVLEMLRQPAFRTRFGIRAY